MGRTEARAIISAETKEVHVDERVAVLEAVVGHMREDIVAIKADIRDIRADIAALRVDLKATNDAVFAVKIEIKDTAAQLRKEIADLRLETRTSLAAVHVSIERLRALIEKSHREL